MKKSHKGYMHEGMKNMANPGHSGMKPPSGSVNSGATRSGPAASPKTLGPRNA